jgi:hypothetical protein
MVPIKKCALVCEPNSIKIKTLRCWHSDKYKRFREISLYCSKEVNKMFEKDK